MLALRPRLLILLLRLAFMELRRRADIPEGAGLARIHVFDRRLPMMHRASWTGKKANSGMAFGVVRVGARLSRGNEHQLEFDGTTVHRLKLRRFGNV